MIYTYRNHNCNEFHRSGREFSKCLWRGAKIEGDGGYAVIYRCTGRVEKVRLFQDSVYAEDAAMETAEQCSDFCDHRKHQAVMLLVGE